MGFFYPQILLWLPPALAGIIVVYLLKKRREPFQVSSVLLWERALKELEANRPFKRLRMNLMLLLDLLLAALLIAMLARPFASGLTITGRTSIIVIDTSASMKTTETEGTRFSIAQNKALRIIDDMSQSDSAIIIEAGSEPRVAQSLTTDKALLRSALNRLEPHDTGADLNSAVKLASGLAMHQSDTNLYLMTDAAGATDPIKEIKKLPLNFIQVGKTDDNMGITTLTVRGGDFKASVHHVLLRVKNFSSKQKRRDMKMTLNGEILDAREVDLRPDESQTFIYEIAEDEEGILRAELTGTDAFGIDDVAHATLRIPEPVKVNIIGGDDMFLERAISITPGIELTRGTLEAAGYDHYNVTIFNSMLPDELPQGTGILVINPYRKVFNVEIKSTVENLSIVDWDRTHPALRFVELGSLNISNSTIFGTPPAWARPIADSTEGPVLWAGEQEHGRRVLCLGFDPMKSDWPLSAGFPIFVANSLKWLANTGDMGQGTSSEKTSSKIFLKSLGIEAPTEIKNPDGSVTKLSAKAAFFRPLDAGIYEFTNAETKLAINMFDEAESNIRPAEALATVEGEKIISSSVVKHTRNEAWRYLAMGALLLLALQWAAYHRRIGE